KKGKNDLFAGHFGQGGIREAPWAHPDPPLSFNKSPPPKIIAMVPPRGSWGHFFTTVYILNYIIITKFNKTLPAKIPRILIPRQPTISAFIIFIKGIDIPLLARHDPFHTLAGRTRPGEGGQKTVEII
ncbi:hypothetical protein KJ865_02590, partial [Myxococcota bacterium]|nr:hypothetical protein [Myxococcota bacterium]